MKKAQHSGQSPISSDLAATSIACSSGMKKPNTVGNHLYYTLAVCYCVEVFLELRGMKKAQHSGQSLSPKHPLLREFFDFIFRGMKKAQHNRQSPGAGSGSEGGSGLGTGRHKSPT